MFLSHSFIYSFALSFIQVQSANILFVDNPVGSGYSYVESDDAFTTTTEEIAEDLYTLLKDFYLNNPELEVRILQVISKSILIYINIYDIYSIRYIRFRYSLSLLVTATCKIFR